jgi:hypothetical protein
VLFGRGVGDLWRRDTWTWNAWADEQVGGRGAREYPGRARRNPIRRMAACADQENHQPERHAAHRTQGRATAP